MRRVKPDGTITTIAGTGARRFSGDLAYAPAADLAVPYGIAVGPDRSVYIGDQGTHRIRRMASVLPEFSASEMVVGSEDGSELYVFNENGRHLRTLDARMHVTLYRFAYDATAD